MKKQGTAIESKARLIAMAMGAIGMVATQILPTVAVTRGLGQVTAHGTVAINGRSAVSGESIFSGDRVDTKNDSTAALSLFGGQEIIQAERSSLILKEEDGQITVAISAGNVAVLSPASTPVEIEARGVRIVPGGDGGVYEVQIVGQELLVTARKGNAEIEAGNQTVRVDEGMKCDAIVGNSQDTRDERKSALGAPILKFTILSAGFVSSAALAVILAEGSSGCAVSPSSTGKCQLVP